MVPRARVVYSVAFFILFMVLMVTAQPRWVFQEDGTPLPFGVGPNRTLFSLGSLTVACAAISLFSFALLDLVYKPSRVGPFLVRLSGGGEGDGVGGGGAGSSRYA